MTQEQPLSVVSHILRMIQLQTYIGFFRSNSVIYPLRMARQDRSLPRSQGGWWAPGGSCWRLLVFLQFLWVGARCQMGSAPGVGSAPGSGPSGMGPGSGACFLYPRFLIVHVCGEYSQKAIIYQVRLAEQWRTLLLQLRSEYNRSVPPKILFLWCFLSTVFFLRLEDIVLWSFRLLHFCGCCCFLLLLLQQLLFVVVCCCSVKLLVVAGSCGGAGGVATVVAVVVCCCCTCCCWCCLFHAVGRGLLLLIVVVVVSVVE